MHPAWLCSLALLRPPTGHSSQPSELVQWVLVIGGSVAFVGATLLVIHLFAGREDARLHGGLTAGRRRTIRQTGQSAQATVLQLRKVEVGSNRTFAAVLEVCSQGQAPYRVEVMEGFSYQLSVPAPDVGSTIPVCIDRSDPKIVVVDVDTLERQAQAASRASEQRQAELELQQQRKVAEERDRLLRGG
jgi:hypothetical protein